MDFETIQPYVIPRGAAAVMLKGMGFRQVTNACPWQNTLQAGAAAK